MTTTGTVHPRHAWPWRDHRTDRWAARARVTAALETASTGAHWLDDGGAVREIYDGVALVLATPDQHRAGQNALPEESAREERLR